MPFSVEGRNRLAHYWERRPDEVMEWGIQRAKPGPASKLTWRIFKRADWWKSINLINFTDEELEWVMAFYIWNKKKEGNIAELNARLKECVLWFDTEEDDDEA